MEKDNSPENLIKITFKTKIVSVIERIEELLKTHDTVILSAINSGISNLVLITEIAKVKLGDLHQINSLETLKSPSNNDDNRERISTRFKVELSKTKVTPQAGSFYQAPYTKEQIAEISSVKNEERNNDEHREEGGYRGRGFRGGFRGRGEGFRGRGEGFRGRGEGFRGRGEGFRGRGEGFRGRGRGDGFRGRGEGEGFRGRGDGFRGRGEGSRGRGRGN